ncbi:MAG: ribosomal protein S18-alanine N-acetyltransferase [Lachnospiraceae bacterium]|nr:ribosomal protein S18-alanine N-acetyltransferase [Lachnospiraceae bacterium]
MFNGICFDRMQASDISAVAGIERETFSLPWSEKGFRDTLHQDYSVYLVAKMEENAEIVGYCGLLQSLDTAELLNVAVRRDQRGRGIGYAMLLRLMELGRERGIRRFTLEVRKSNEAALQLYKKLGFSPAGIRRRFYEKPVEDAVIMWTD